MAVPQPPSAQELVEQLVNDEGYTPADIAAAGKMSPSTVYRWQEGLANARPRSLSLVLKGLGKDPVDYGLPRVRDEDPPAWAVAMDAKLDEILSRLDDAEHQ